MTKTPVITIKVSLMILPIVFFAYTLEAFEVDEVTSEYDSIYRYNALENKVDFYKIGSDTTFLLE